MYVRSFIYEKGQFGNSTGNLFGSEADSASLSNDLRLRFSGHLLERFAI
jgi:hypothetical protein